MIKKDMIVDFYGDVYTVKAVSADGTDKWFCFMNDANFYTDLNEEDLVPLNPLPGILQEKVFVVLYELGVFNRTTLRDLAIKRRFMYMKHKEYKKPKVIMEILRTKYKYLADDTIRKAVHIGMPVYRNLVNQLFLEG